LKVVVVTGPYDDESFGFCLLQKPVGKVGSKTTVNVSCMRDYDGSWYYISYLFGDTYLVKRLVELFEIGFYLGALLWIK